MRGLIGLLSPGEMGASLGAALALNGFEVGWVSTNRSDETWSRAREFTPFANESELCERAIGIVSICPPSAALSQAKRVASSDFSGVYVDANAVAPTTASEISDIFGDRYVDGGIVGPPAVKNGTTRLFLSSTQADQVVTWFEQGYVEAIALSDSATAASALKVAYAAYTKGLSALLLGVNAFARASGIDEALYEEWARSQPHLIDQSHRAALGTSRKAWRFVGEMEEIANSFASKGLPADFHRGAASLYSRMASLKDQPSSDLELVIQTLLK